MLGATISIVTLYTTNIITICLILIKLCAEIVINRGVKKEMKNNNSGAAVVYVGKNYIYVSSLMIELQPW